MATEAAKVMPRAPRKAKAYIDHLLGTRQLSRDGLNWLTCATDPFHDSEVDCPGYPDLNTSRSITQVFQYTKSVSKPSSVTTGNWDCHVPFIPISYPFGNYPGPGFLTGWNIQNTGNWTVGASVDAIPLYSGYNIITGPTGFDWGDVGTGAGALTNDPTLGYPLKGSTGHFRLVAAGMEVHNTTAELYKGGSITVYRAPSIKTPIQLNKQKVEAEFTTTKGKDNATSYFFPCTYDTFALPPTTQSNAQLYPSARTWNAEDGAYVVATMSDNENPFRIAAPSNVVGVTPFSVTDLTSGTNNTIWASDTPTLSGIGQGQNCRVLPFETSGVILAGLNANSSLQVTVKYYVERIPTIQEADLLALARPPAEFDALALQIYSRSLCDLPVGVPVGENPLGEWFTSVLDSVMAVGPKVGKLLQGVGNALNPDENRNSIPHNVQPVAQKNMTNNQKKQMKSGNNMQKPSAPKKRKRNKKKKAKNGPKKS